MIILGIDPGTATIGFGIIKKNKEIKLVEYGCIKTPTTLTTAERLEELHNQLNALIKKYKPDMMSVEDIFFFKNLKTAVKVSQARGAILLTAAKSKIPVFECTPLQIKQAIKSPIQSLLANKVRSFLICLKKHLPGSALMLVMLRV